jgi:rRNA maturation protein Nop10
MSAAVKLVVCKSCGFVMEEGKLKDKCPACGVSSKMFEPYNDRVSPARKRILDLHIHPVIVHAPQALMFLMLVVSLYMLASSLLAFLPSFKNDLYISYRFMALILPVVIVAAFLGGLLDGKIRFRRVTTPLLVRKMVLGGIFFVISLVLLFTVFLLASAPLAMAVTLTVFGAAGMTASALLGLIGASINNSRFPG